MDESKRVSTNTVDLTCAEVLSSAPTTTTEVVVSNFIVGKRKTTIDFDGDNKWDLVGVPLFPAEKQNTKYGYNALIVCCKGIPDEEAFQKAFSESTKQLAVDFWPQRQDLDRYIHSGLAQHYLNLDFSKSQIALVGYDRTNPVFSEATLQWCYLVGGIAVGIGVLTLLFTFLEGVYKRFLKRKQETEYTGPTQNLAGLPNNDRGATGGVLDRVRSLRDRQTEGA